MKRKMSGRATVEDMQEQRLLHETEKKKRVVSKYKPSRHSR